MDLYPAWTTPQLEFLPCLDPSLVGPLLCLYLPMSGPLLCLAPSPAWSPTLPGPLPYPCMNLSPAGTLPVILLGTLPVIPHLYRSFPCLDPFPTTAWTPPPLLGPFPSLDSSPACIPPRLGPTPAWTSTLSPCLNPSPAWTPPLPGSFPCLDPSPVWIPPLPGTLYYLEPILVTVWAPLQFVPLPC